MKDICPLVSNIKGEFFMLGIYNYTVILTYVGLLVGYFGITRASGGDIYGALLCLLVAGVFDLFDGKVASTKKDRTKSERRFGIQIDSLSDVICFGVLPATIVYALTGGKLYALGASALYALSALIRLAYFNVDEEQRQDTSDGERQFYLGLPVTTSALLVPLVIGLGLIFSWKMNIIATVMLLIMAVAFITPFRLKKPAMTGKIIAVFCGCAELAILILGMRL